VIGGKVELGDSLEMEGSAAQVLWLVATLPLQSTTTDSTCAHAAVQHCQRLMLRVLHQTQMLQPAGHHFALLTGLKILSILCSTRLCFQPIFRAILVLPIDFTNIGLNQIDAIISEYCFSYVHNTVNLIRFDKHPHNTSYFCH